MCHPPIFNSKSPVYKPKKLSQTQIILYRSEEMLKKSQLIFILNNFLWSLHQIKRDISEHIDSFGAHLCNVILQQDEKTLFFSSEEKIK